MRELFASYRLWKLLLYGLTVYVIHDRFLWRVFVEIHVLFRFIQMFQIVIKLIRLPSPDKDMVPKMGTMSLSGLGLTVNT